VVVVVADPVLVASGRAGGLDAPEQALVGQDAERVVHRLAGDRTDLGPHDLVDVVGGAVRSGGYGPQHGQTLRRDLESVPAQEGIVVDGRRLGHAGEPKTNAGVCPELDLVCRSAGFPRDPHTRKHRAPDSWQDRR
jgi:hypothetical protein